MKGCWLALALIAAQASAASLPQTVSQGGLVIASLPVGTHASLGSRKLRVGADGVVVFGAGRDQRSPLTVQLDYPDGHRESWHLTVTPRAWPIERVNGVPPQTVNPSPPILARIIREQNAIAAARVRDDNREDFLHSFIWPVHGRISGRFGNRRIYNGQAAAPHSGMDIAVPVGTPVLATADGIVTFAQPDLYLTGGTLMVDHGFGLSSNYFHLSQLNVHVGDRVKQGQVIALSGKSGRVTGPHLHWGFNWFATKLDPLLMPGIDQAETQQP